MSRFPFPRCKTVVALVLILFARLNFFISGINDDGPPTSTNAAITKPEDFPSTPSPEDYLEDFDEPIYDIQELEAILGGSIQSRKFVYLERVGSSKTVELPYKFRTRGKPRKTREDVGDKYNLDNETVQELKKVPQGFQSNTVYIRYDSQKLSGLELTGDTTAKLGDPWLIKRNLEFPFVNKKLKTRATNIMAFDYCERAAFPNKGKMVCNTVSDPSRGLVANTCICKYYRMHPKTPKWKQLPAVELKLELSGKIESRMVCLIPRGGVCNHRISTGLWNKNRRAIYEVDVCRGHFQCDNRQFLKGAVLDMKSHCSEKEFLEKFEAEDKDNVLLCSKPHSRKFSEYDEYKYYCLPQYLQAPDDEYQNSLPPSTAYDADEKEEADVL